MIGRIGVVSLIGRLDAAFVLTLSTNAVGCFWHVLCRVLMTIMHIPRPVRVKLPPRALSDTDIDDIVWGRLQ